jgi:hypothetical protein
MSHLPVEVRGKWNVSTLSSKKLYICLGYQIDQTMDLTFEVYAQT